MFGRLYERARTDTQPNCYVARRNSDPLTLAITNRDRALA